MLKRLDVRNYYLKLLIQEQYLELYYIVQKIFSIN